MKTKKIPGFICGILFYAVLQFFFSGYMHLKAHPPINEMMLNEFVNKAVNKTFVKNPDKYKLYEFKLNTSNAPKLVGPALNAQEYYLSYSSSDEYNAIFTPLEWIRAGAWMEDEPWGPACLCHFYDPLAIDGGKYYLTDRATKIEGCPLITPILWYNSVDAKTWSTMSGNKYNWPQAKDYVVQALKESKPSERARFMALAYRCLGETLHLIADMGCPPHVRNDSHPPKLVIAGLTVFGDPDPYEDLTGNINLMSFTGSSYPVNTEFRNEVGSVSSMEQIFEKMALFTNGRIPSNQTIATTRYKQIIRPNNPYPNPSIQEADYRSDRWTYVKNYDGREILMCKDKHPYTFLNGNYRGQPYIDQECVESQASMLIPNIVEAGANVIKIFVPAIKVEVTEAKVDSGGVIRGKVSYALPSADDEYLGLFDANNTYNGPVSLFVNGVDVQITAEAVKNNFEFKLNGALANLKKEDKICAKIEFGGIIVRSEDSDITGAAPVIISIIPGNGKINDDVAIWGSNLGTDKTKGKVYFYDNVEAASITNWTDTKIDLKIPAGAKTGNVYVVYQNVKSNNYSFTVNIVLPTISSLSKFNGIIGDTISITGKDFGSTQGTGKVFFGSKQAEKIISWTDTKITVIIPSGVDYSSYVYVEVNGYRNTDTRTFTTYNWWLPLKEKFTFMQPNVGVTYTFNDGTSGSDLSFLMAYPVNMKWNGMKFSAELTTVDVQTPAQGYIYTTTTTYKYSGELDNNGMNLLSFDGLKILCYSEQTFVNSKLIDLDSTVTTIQFKLKNIPYYGTFSFFPTGGASYYNNPNFQVYNSAATFELVGYDIWTISIDYSYTPPRVTENLKSSTGYSNVRLSQFEMGAPKP